MITRQREIARALTAMLLVSLALPGGAVAAVAATPTAGAVPARPSGEMTALLGQIDDDIPGVPIPASPIAGTLDDVYSAFDFDDVYAVRLGYNQRLSATMTGDAGTDFDLWLWKPGSTSVNDPSPWSHIAQSSQTNGTSAESFNYPASQPGTYYVDVFTDPGTSPNRGAYALTWSVVQLPSPPIEVAVKPATCGYNGSSVITGTVTLDGAPLSDARVLVQGRPSGSSTWVSLNYDKTARPVAPRTKTRTDGSFSYTATGITRKMEYRAIVWPSATWGWRTSAMVSVTPRAYLTRPYAPKKVRRNAKFRVHGYLKTQHRSGGKHVKITAYRATEGTWRYARSYNYGSYTKYSTTMSLPTKGKWKLVATVSADGDHLATTSSATYLSVK